MLYEAGRSGPGRLLGGARPRAPPRQPRARPPGGSGRAVSTCPRRPKRGSRRRRSCSAVPDGTRPATLGRRFVVLWSAGTSVRPRPPGVRMGPRGPATSSSCGPRARRGLRCPRRPSTSCSRRLGRTASWYRNGGDVATRQGIVHLVKVQPPRRGTGRPDRGRLHAHYRQEKMARNGRWARRSGQPTSARSPDLGLSATGSRVVGLAKGRADVGPAKDTGTRPDPHQARQRRDPQERGGDHQLR